MIAQPTHNLPVEETFDVVEVTKAIGDPLRANILQVLAGDAFGVLELAEVFNMAQPAMSHHLKKLAHAGLVSKRKEGTSVYYQRGPTYSSAVLEVLFQALDARTLPNALRRGIKAIHQHRAQRSQQFFSTQRDALAQQTQLICAPDVYLQAVLEMALSAQQQQHALEVGPGSGALLNALASHFGQVVGIDNAQEMLHQTHALTDSVKNVELVEGDFATLTNRPTYDLVVAAMVVHHMPSPQKFFSQAAKLLQAGGVLVIAELCSHNQDWVRKLCGDVWLGFAPEELNHWASQAGLAQSQRQFLAQNNGFRVQVSAFTSQPQFD